MKVVVGLFQSEPRDMSVFVADHASVAAMQCAGWPGGWELHMWESHKHTLPVSK